MRLAVLSNVNLDALIRNLKKDHEVFETAGYGQWVSYAMEQRGDLERFQPKIIFLLLDGNALLESCFSYEEGRGEIETNAAYLRQLAQNYPQSMIAVSTLDIAERRIYAASEYGEEGLWEADWLRHLREIMRQRDNVTVFPLKQLLEQHGSASFYSSKMWYMGSIPYDIRSIALLEREIGDFIRRYTSTRKKVLVIDLDNTIWGGAVGEEGPTGVTLGTSLLGAAYRDAQKRIQQIGQTGILLAVVSKNNREDVEEIFEKNPFMVLKKDDFVSIIANWEPKPQNILELASDLNLGLDAFVFLDDNEVERQAVRSQLPDVAVADFPRDIAALPDAIMSLYRQYFWCWKQTKEDAEKTEQYRQEAQRKSDLAAAATMEDYLLSLDIHILLGEVQDDQVPRAVQLLNKTNQFNTNTLRLDTQQFMQYREATGHQIYMANVSDRYGDSGLVTELLLRREGDTVYIDDFLMSCRVMGRQIEHAVIHAIAERLTAQGVQTIQSKLIYTAKNKPVEKLWDQLGFTLIEETEQWKQYELHLPCQMKSLLEVEWRI